MNDEAESTKATPRIIKRRRDPLTTLSGLLTEASRVYRKMKSGQLDHDKGRSLVWVLAQMRAMVEAQHLERIEAKLNELQASAENRGLLPNGQARTVIDAGLLVSWQNTGSASNDPRNGDGHSHTDEPSQGQT